MKWAVIITRAKNFPENDSFILESALLFLKQKINQGVVVMAYSSIHPRADWVIIEAASEQEAWDVLGQSPLAPYVNCTILNEMPDDIEEWPNSPNIMPSTESLEIMISKARRTVAV